MEAYLQHGKAGGPYLTERVPVKEAPLWWHKRGLSYTASGYGGRIPTLYMVRHNGKWRRVYCAIYSNVGTTYIGKRWQSSDAIAVSIERE